MNRHVCWHSLNRLVGKHHSLSSEEKLQLASKLSGFYHECTIHFTDYSTTVIRPYDNYLLLACQMYWEIWQETLENDLFWKAAILLTNALKTSPASYNLRLLLIKFLNQIGAVGASHHFHAGLELKHVQLDSMGYILSRHIQSCGHFHASISLMSSTLKFFNTNYKDVIIFDMHI